MSPKIWYQPPVRTVGWFVILGLTRVPTVPRGGRLLPRRVFVLAARHLPSHFNPHRQAALLAALPLLSARLCLTAAPLAERRPGAAAEQDSILAWAGRQAVLYLCYTLDRATSFSVFWLWPRIAFRGYRCAVSVIWHWWPQLQEISTSFFDRSIGNKQVCLPCLFTCLVIFRCALCCWFVVFVDASESSV